MKFYTPISTDSDKQRDINQEQAQKLHEQSTVSKAATKLIHETAIVLVTARSLISIVIIRGGFVCISPDIKISVTTSHRCGLNTLHFNPLKLEGQLLTLNSNCPM